MIYNVKTLKPNNSSLVAAQKNAELLAHADHPQVKDLIKHLPI